MIKLNELNEYFSNLLDINAVHKDYSNNGLQVEGKEDINKVMFAVDISLEAIEKAIAINADMIFVHHGLSWGGGLKYLTGIDGKRVKKLMQNDISLFAVHLPLDGHETLGHNAKLAEMINLDNKEPYAKYCGLEIGSKGELREPQPVAELAKIYDNQINSTSKIFGDKNRPVLNIGIISGGGGMDGLLESIRVGCDCFITGEVGHTMYHFIKEADIPVISLGHYASEQPGLIAVMDKIKNKFDIEVEFVDIPTGL